MKNARESACNICGVKRKHAKESARRFLSCPDPKKVESYLKDTTGVDICLRDGDLICYSCYRFCTIPILFLSPHNQAHTCTAFY